MFRLTKPLLCCALAVGVPGQVPMPWSWHEVPHAGAVALGVLWQHGFDDDAGGLCGAARLLGECRLERARAAVPGLRGSGMQVAADATVAFVLADAADWPRALAFVQALLDDRAPIDDDVVALVTARAALAADDGEFLHPGLVLQSRARLVLCRGTPAGRPVAGSAPAIQSLAPDRVRELLREPVAVRGAGLGALPTGLREAVAAWSSPVPAVAAPRSTSAPEFAVPQPFTPHDRVDAPFVAAAFAAPPAARLPAFALGVEVARMRAQRRFRARSSEAMARAPFVGWSWLHGDAVVVFCRRGADPQKLLEGEAVRADAAAEQAATRAELEGLLEDLRCQPASAAEVAAARRTLQSELALSPLPAAGADPLALDAAALPGRVQVLLLGAHRGIDAKALAEVAPQAVHAELVAALQPERAYWCGLQPRPLPRVGWLPR